MKRKIRVVARLLGLIVAGVMVWPLHASANQQCDCTVRIGSCQGAIEFVKAFGSKPSFGAQFIVHSNHGQCSKVEYFIHDSPHQTVLVNRFEEQESTFGTSPFKESDIQFEACYICKPVGAQPEQSGATQAREQQADLSGKWLVSGRCSFGTGSSTMILTRQGEDSYSISGKLPNHKIQSGSVAGASVDVTGSHWLGNQSHYVGKVDSPTSMSGTFTQQSTSEECTWSARKQ